MKTWLGYDVNFDNPNKSEYNDIPVYYCKDCLSLAVEEQIEGLLGCNNCNSGNICQCSIEEWELMFYKKYKYHYLERKSMLVDGVRTKIK